MLNTLVYVGIALLLGLIAGKVMKIIKLPNVTGYIVFGLIFGPYVLNLLPLNTVNNLSIMSDLALGFIAFSIGSEFRLSYLKKIGKAPIVIAVLEGLGAVFAVDIALILCGCDVAFSLVLGAIASATAPASTIMVVKQYKAKGPVSETLLPVVAIDDAVALIAFAISVAAANIIEKGGAANLTATIMQPVIEIGGAILFGGILGILASFLVHIYTGRGNRLSIAIALICLCVGISSMCGFSSLLACMMMGSVFINTSHHYNELFALTDRFTPPLYILFFVISGASLNIKVLPTIGIIGVAYIVTRVIGKALGAYLGGVICHVPDTVKKFLGFALVPQEGVAIGLSIAAMTVVPDYAETIRAVILCGTIIYELTGPIATKLTLKCAGEISKDA